jgi:hypothetical protein
MSLTFLQLSNIFKLFQSDNTISENYRNEKRAPMKIRAYLYIDRVVCCKTKEKMWARKDLNLRPTA